MALWARPDLQSGLTPSLTYLGFRSEETGKIRKQTLASVATPRGRNQELSVCLLPEMLGLRLQCTADALTPWGSLRLLFRDPSTLQFSQPRPLPAEWDPNSIPLFFMHVFPGARSMLFSILFEIKIKKQILEAISKNHRPAGIE